MNLNKLIAGAGALVVVIIIALGIYWSDEPEIWDVREHAAAEAQRRNEPMVVGYVTTTTLIHLAEILLEKPGGYLTNDMTPPGIYLDNIPNWEFGALVQIRDMARALRKDISRSQSTSAEDPDLSKAEPRFNFDNKSFMFPSSEGEYRQGIEFLERFRKRLADPADSSAQFFSRSDNLRNWLADVETRLGSISQRLSASVGKDQANVDLAGDDAAQRSTPAPEDLWVKTPFFQIDNVFYEARGTSWALLHLLKAVEIDFQDVLRKKSAQTSLKQIILELEKSQESLWSPMVLNGSGFGMLANHSLVMASYLSRVNAAMIDLRNLLSQG
jgi:hypothetical protein